MDGIAHHPDEVWDRFFEFLYLCDAKLSRSEIQDGLKRMGIDVSKAVTRVKQALATAQAREQLALASKARPTLLAKLHDITFALSMTFAKNYIK